MTDLNNHKILIVIITAIIVAIEVYVSIDVFSEVETQM